MWLVQMPWLLSATDREALQRELLGATRERMLREMAELLEDLTAQTLLLLVLEDLHWSDTATLDLLAYLARRQEPARLLVLGTYRPVEVSVSGHPLKGLTHELQLQGQCAELPLELLSETEVAAYVATRLAGGVLEAELPLAIYQCTEGLPLFMVTLVDYLVPHGVLVEHEGRWSLKGGIEAVEQSVPESIRQMIEQQFEQLAIEEQRVLTAASAAGMAFSAAAVAAALGKDVVAVEERFEALARRQYFLRPTGNRRREPADFGLMLPYGSWPVRTPQCR
jgi:predicted ATPase